MCISVKEIEWLALEILVDWRLCMFALSEIPGGATVVSLLDLLVAYFSV